MILRIMELSPKKTLRETDCPTIPCAGGAQKRPQGLWRLCGGGSVRFLSIFLYQEERNQEWEFFMWFYN